MFQRIITENWLLLSLELIVIFFADLRCIAREFKIRIFKNYSCGQKNYIFLDVLRGIKFSESLKFSFFTNFSPGEQNHFFFVWFTRHKTLSRLKNDHFRAQVTIIADSRFFFWSVYEAYFKSLYNNWRLSVIAKIIVQ